VRRAAIALAAFALLATPAGCDLSDDDDEQPRAAAPRKQDPLRTPEGRIIRDWLMALERSDYGQAATYFAPGAIVDQGRPIRLPDAAAARFFNASLPCRADLIRLRDEGAKVLASFRLRHGPGGPCEGVVQVRFTIKRGRFTEWRQLVEPEPPSPDTGPVV
jgi:hypothetical protein